jgi:tetratricopeptide (TPR) repeat protein
MKQFIMALAILLAPVAASPAEPGLAGDFDGRIDRGLTALYQGDYELAFDTYDSIIRDHPANPAGYFLKSGAYQLKAMAHETEAWDQKYTACLDSAMDLSQAAVKANSRDAWAFFFRGGTYAYLAARAARRASYLSALSNGLSALSDLNRALELDPGLYDAYLGIGSYHYFRTKATSIIKWLPFIGDARDRGIEEIKLAVAKGRFSRVTAQNGLLWIYIDYGKYDQAVELGLQLEKEFPQNHVFFWSVP